MCEGAHRPPRIQILTRELHIQVSLRHNTQYTQTWECFHKGGCEDVQPSMASDLEAGKQATCL